MKLIIGYAGIIASGKTTYANSFESRIGKDYIDTKDIKNDCYIININEKVEGNNYLKLFYGDMKKYSYLLELYMLLNRSNDRQNEINNPNHLVSQTMNIFVEDRTVYEDIIFVEMLHDSGHLNDNQYKTLCDIYNEVIKTITPYDIIYWNKVSAHVAHERMKGRGRDIEKNLPLEYLEKLEAKYEKKFLNLIPKNTKVVIIDNSKELDLHEEVTNTEKIYKDLYENSIDMD